VHKLHATAVNPADLVQAPPLRSATGALSQSTWTITESVARARRRIEFAAPLGLLEGKAG